MSATSELWVRIGVPVHDQPGRLVGTVDAVAVSPTLSRLTHVSVAPDEDYSDARLVPIGDLSPGDGYLQLIGDHAWPGRYERTYEVEFLAPDEDPRYSLPYPYAHHDLLVWDGLDTPFGAGRVIRDHLPPGEEPLYAGALVRSSDGEPIGHVAGFLVHPATDEVSHVVLRHGHLWGRRTVLLPIELVDRLEAGDLLVRGTVDELDRYAID